MAKVRRRVTEGRFASRGGRRQRRRQRRLQGWNESAADENAPQLEVPSEVEQSLLSLDASKDFQDPVVEDKRWRDVVFGWFKRSNQKGNDSGRALSGIEGEDPVRDILSVPRGPARLDAFQRVLSTLSDNTPGHRGVAIAFHRELVGMAETANIDLVLLKARVESCAKALMAAGEHEVAGMLLARIGRRHQAAEMFVAAGAIEKLERAHDEIERLESGDRLSARLCYERFEGLFLVGFRQEALAALEEACELWPTHPVYQEILQRFELRLPSPAGVLLKAGSNAVVVRRKWPLQVGRDNKAALALKSPLVSRQHLELANTDNGVVVLPVEVPSETHINGVLLERAVDLESGTGTIDIRGVVVNYALGLSEITLWPEHGEGPRLLAPLASSFDVVLGDVTLHLRIDDDGHLILPLSKDLRLNGDVVRRSTFLLCDDRLEVDGHLIEVLRL